MNDLLIFFAIPFATIILAIVLERIIRVPILVAATFFSIYLVVAFVINDMTFLILTIVYTVLAYIAAVVYRFFVNMRNCGCSCNRSCNCNNICNCENGTDNSNNNNGSVTFVNNTPGTSRDIITDTITANRIICNTADCGRVNGTRVVCDIADCNTVNGERVTCSTADCGTVNGDRINTPCLNGTRVGCRR